MTFSDPRIRWVVLLLIAAGSFVWIGLVPLARYLESWEASTHREKAQLLSQLPDIDLLQREPSVSKLVLFDVKGEGVPLSVDAAKILGGENFWKVLDKNRWLVGAPLLDDKGAVRGGVAFEYHYNSLVTGRMIPLLLLVLGLLAGLGKIFWPEGRKKTENTETLPDWDWLELLAQVSGKRALVSDPEGRLIAAGGSIPNGARHLFDLEFARPEALWQALQKGESSEEVKVWPWKGNFILCVD